MGRYTLWLGDNPVESYTKVRLSDIDRFTVDYSSDEELIKALQERGITGVNRLKIGYRMNQEMKYVAIALDDKKMLTDLNLNAKGNPDCSSPTFKKYIRKFINAFLSDKEFYNRCMRSSLLNERIKEYIELVKYRNNIFYENKLIEHLSTYLQFRNIVFLLSEYENPKKEKDKPIEIKEKEEPKGYLYDENFTQEEIEAYQEYMDNLPDEGHPHDFDSRYKRR